MPTTYEKCDDTVRELLNKLIGEYHSPLKAAEVTFDLVFASKTDKDDQPCAAIKLHGVAAAAKVKITHISVFASATEATANNARLELRFLFRPCYN